MTQEERALKKQKKLLAQEVKDSMTFEQLISFVNTDYRDLPENLRIGMTKHPQKFHFVEMMHPKMGKQQETFASRLIRFREKYHLSVEEFASIANEFGWMYGVRITSRDIVNYENYNICPKIDKMMAISEAMGVPIDYFAGYGTSNRRSKNDLIESRCREHMPCSISYKKEMERRKGTETVNYFSELLNQTTVPSA